MSQYTTDQLATILTDHRKWLMKDKSGSRAVLMGANLTGAVLTGAVLTGANLTGAVLTHAVLMGAVLMGANLTGAVLRGADLRGAVLTDAVLTDADLRGAVLRGAVLTDATRIETGETWREYLTETVPQLLLAGERGAEAIRRWGGHEWNNCPMHVAFNINDADRAPALLRPRVRQFVQFYDARLIPRPEQSILTAEQPE